MFGASTEEQWLPRRRRSVGSPCERQDVRGGGAMEGASVHGEVKNQWKHGEQTK